jgi:transposase InsO family protein
VRNILLKFGIPEVVLTDQGSNFLSELFQNTCKLLRIKRIHTTAFHPESNGGTVRGHYVENDCFVNLKAEDLEIIWALALTT